MLPPLVGFSIAAKHVTSSNIVTHMSHTEPSHTENRLHSKLTWLPGGGI